MSEHSIIPFRVRGAEVLTKGASVALTDNLAALYTLGTLLEAYGNQSKPFDDGACFGVAQIVKLIAGNISDKVEAEILPLETATVYALLEAERKGANHENG